MRNTLKNLVVIGVAGTLPALALLAEETCPASAAAKEACCATADACCASKAVAAATCPADSQAKLVKVSYKVAGMSCAACETKVKGELAKIAGVSEPAACAESKQVKLAYDPAKVKEDQLMAAINKIGFKVEAEMVDLKVEGMKCTACSTKVSQKLAAVKGVSEQQVCHEGQKALVTFDPNKVSRKDIIAAIDSTGFKVAQ
jgi:copper ion binding protein